MRGQTFFGGLACVAVSFGGTDEGSDFSRGHMIVEVALYAIDIRQIPGGQGF